MVPTKHKYVQGFKYFYITIISDYIEIDKKLMGVARYLILHAWDNFGIHVPYILLLFFQ